MKKILTILFASPLCCNEHDQTAAAGQKSI
jgi:hypothetical protein